MKTTSIRIFFAITLDEELQKIIEKRVHNLKKQPGGANIHWHPVEKLHITLHFLGKIPVETLPLCIASVKESIENTAPFYITLGPLITLPAHRPRIVAIAVPLSLELAELFYKTKVALETAGFTLETRPYLPHITLGKTKSRIPVFTEKTILQKPFQQCVHEIVLLQSVSIPEGSNVYTVIERFGFNNKK